MKTTIIWMVVLVIAGSGMVWAQEAGNPLEPEKEYKLSKAYAHRDEQLVLSWSDYFGCFVLEKNPDKSLFITDLKTFSDEGDFSTPDLISDVNSVYLNRGENSGLRKGQKYLISGIEGVSVMDHALVVRKGIGEIVNVYSETAELKIVNLYNPVEIGDFLVEFKDEPPISRMKVAYENTVIPDDADSARVYLPTVITFGRTIIGPEQFVAVEMGRDKISVGDYVVFFRRLKPHLPPLIIGTGMALVVGDTMSTLKTIDLSSPLIEGSEAAILPEPEIVQGRGEGPVPVVRRISDVRAESAGEELLTVEILFDIDSFLVDEAQSEQLVKIKTFIESKTAYSILLKGYCCSIGNEEKNMALSQKRVESVKKILMEQLAVPESQLETAYYGEKEAPYDNSSEAERRKNRLVMVVVAGT